MNHLRPNIKRGNISDQEEDLILRLHKLLGNRQAYHYFPSLTFLLSHYFSMKEIHVAISVLTLKN